MQTHLLGRTAPLRHTNYHIEEWFQLAQCAATLLLTKCAWQSKKKKRKQTFPSVILHQMQNGNLSHGKKYPWMAMLNKHWLSAFDSLNIWGLLKEKLHEDMHGAKLVTWAPEITFHIKLFCKQSCSCEQTHTHTFVRYQKYLWQLLKTAMWLNNCVNKENVL